MILNQRAKKTIVTAEASDESFLTLLTDSQKWLETSNERMLLELGMMPEAEDRVRKSELKSGFEGDMKTACPLPRLQTDSLS